MLWRAFHESSLTLATIASSRVYRFPVRKLERFLLKNPNFQDAFLVKAVYDLRNTQRQLIVMGRFKIQQRLAVFLVDCSAHEHYFDQSKQILTLPMSRYDIADYLGTSGGTRPSQTANSRPL